jgi:hypothetical protein
MESVNEIHPAVSTFIKRNVARLPVIGRIVNLFDDSVSYEEMRHDTEPIARKFHQRKSGMWIGPDLDELMDAVPHFYYLVQLYDRQHRLIAEQYARNGVTREGLGYLIGCGFAVTSPATKKTNFYVTQSTTNTAFVSTMTISSPSYTEITYSSGQCTQTVRPTLTLGAISTGADLTEADNSASKAVFTATLTAYTEYGASTVSVNASGTSASYTGDILYGYTVYGTALAVQSGYESDLSLTISATAG